MNFNFNVFGRKAPQSDPIDSTDNNTPSAAPRQSPKFTKNDFDATRQIANDIKAFFSNISSGFTKLSSSVSRIFFGKKDDVFYSKETIQGANASDNDKPASIPLFGSFIAGTDLLQKLTISLFKSVVSEATETTGTSDTTTSSAYKKKGGEQFNKDICRCESMTIKDEDEVGSMIGFAPARRPDETAGETISDKELIATEAKGKLAHFIGGKNNYPFAYALFSLANQTIGNTCGYSLKSNLDPHLMVDTAIGFPAPISNGKLTYLLNYTLERKRAARDTTSAIQKSEAMNPFIISYENLPDHFILTMKLHGSTDQFTLNKPKGEAGADHILLKEGIVFDDSISIEIRPNQNFNPGKTENKSNFPFSLEVQEFKSTYWKI